MLRRAALLRKASHTVKGGAAAPHFQRPHRRQLERDALNGQPSAAERLYAVGSGADFALTTVPSSSALPAQLRCDHDALLPAGFPASETVGVLYWMNDLRVHDHYPLAFAQRRAAELGGVPVVAVCCFDVRAYAQPSRVLGCYRMSPQRATFTIACVAALRDELAKSNVPLIVRCGLPEVMVPELMAQLRCRDCYTATQYAPHEKYIHDSLLDGPTVQQPRGVNTRDARPHTHKKASDGRSRKRAATHPTSACATVSSCQFHSVWHSTLIHPDDLATPLAALRDGFRWFHDDALVANVRPTRPFACTAALQALPSLMPYFNEAELDRRLAEDADEPTRQTCGLGDLPTLEELGYPTQLDALEVTHVIGTSSSHPTAGEEHASAHLEEWLAQGGPRSMLRLNRVKRSPVKMYAHDLLRISPYIATGCMSPRRFYERLKEYAYDNALDGSSHLQFHEAMLRLSRRDYWHFQGAMKGNAMFYSYGPTPENTDEVADWRFDEKVIRKWCHGLTGFPFADASMRELLATGWVGDPGRQAIMWLLASGLNQDWRAGAEWLERCSLDYDPFVCYGNCAYVAKLMPDDFGDNVHTLSYLAHQHDQTGIYIKKWLPQLSKVPSVYIHRPHVMSERMQAMHGVAIGKSYPYPLKLWDGAQQSLGPSELTAYFATPLQKRTYGVGEAAAFSREAMLPAADRHLVAGANSYLRAEALLAASVEEAPEEASVMVARVARSDASKARRILPL